MPTHDHGPNESNQNEPYLEFFTALLAQPDSALPQVLSVSYGEEEQSVPKEYALKVCNLIMQLGARGMSVLFSSGDDGPGNSCTRLDNKPYFQPGFPASCPFVTAVGGTEYQNGERGTGLSGGGFSDIHERPAYQKAVVDRYLQGLGSTYSAYFNSSNRGFPDISAPAQNFLVINKGGRARIGGTSASAPVVAGIVGLLNAARRAQGKPSLGFLNPWLYSIPTAFNDITSGSSQGCGTPFFRNNEVRWNCTAGWDPVTGMGTPNFPAMLEAAAPGTKNA